LRRLAPTATVREAGDGERAIALIRGWTPQAVFLDIQLPAGNGFDVIDGVGTAAMPPTVFVTAYDAHAMHAFDVAAVDYLLKPFDEERFAAAFERVARAVALGTLADGARQLAGLMNAVRQGTATTAASYPERFVVKVGERTILVPVADVRYIQSDGNYVDLFTAAGTHTIRETLASVETRLDPARFVRIHRRAIVAIDAIRELQPWFGGDQVLVLKDGTKLRISRTRREAVAARLAGLG
ncbi:MAG: LytTR family DNA-binding domain-containing protein, partial [Gemmatimonadaceae bacterium]|nr:LytTR family DNA-binding domain-containing protein [Gemmatimonadaceae bacterium]